MPTKIGVISDTHGLLRPEVCEALSVCDMIIHGGDINKPEIIEELERIAPLYVVRGNNDKEWAEHLPASLTFTIEDCKFFLKKCWESQRRWQELMWWFTDILTSMRRI